MREYKGTWHDLFAGFKVALHLSKMFLGFVGLVWTALLVYASVQIAHWTNPQAELVWPSVLVPHEFLDAQLKAWHVIFTDGRWYGQIVYGLVYTVLFLGVWSFLGGAICRIAAYEVARDGERIELKSALKFAREKFPSLIGSFVLCVLGFLFFFLCNFIVGAVFRFLEIAFIGSLLGAVLLPLAILSGFIMMLILVGSLAGWPLFLPAVGAEGTDAFDAVSRGYSYVYSAPWHYIWYQIVAAVYGWVCVAFVFVFAISMTWLGAQAAAWGWNGASRIWGKQAVFTDVNRKAISNVLSEEWYHRATGPGRIYSWRPERILRAPHPYGRIMHLANYMVWRLDVAEAGVHGPGDEVGVPRRILETPVSGFTSWQGQQKIAYYIVALWMILVAGMAWGYAVAYFFTQQTITYMILRKKVDGIEMNEVYEEPELETEASQPAAPQPAAPPPPAEGQKKEEQVEKKAE